MCQVRAPYRKCVSLTAGRALSCRDATGDAVLPGSWSEESTGACGHELGLRDRYWGIGSLSNRPGWLAGLPWRIRPAGRCPAR
jgi:hypothetical protein